MHLRNWFNGGAAIACSALAAVVLVYLAMLGGAGRSNAGAATAAPATTTDDHSPAVPRFPRAHTYSIVARDPETGDIGVAVQSHAFRVGAMVPWAEAGVGAVATQSLIEPSYGSNGLALMRGGAGAADALKALLAKDAQRDLRQVAMIDARGGVAVHTGAKCIDAAGDHAGANYSVQANLMAKATVWPAMARAFETSRGDLAERMLAALDAAQAEGGDLRGRQAAALLVVRGTATGDFWKDRVFDVRVDDHPEPLKELRRLVTLQRAYRHTDDGDHAAESNDAEAAAREYAAAERIAPDQMEIVFWHAVMLVNLKRTDEALPLFRRLFAADPNWKELTRRLVKSGLLPNDKETLEGILAAGGEGDTRSKP